MVEEEEELRKVVGIPGASILVKHYSIEEFGVGMVGKLEWQIKEEDNTKLKTWTMVIFFEDTNAKNVHYDLCWKEKDGVCLSYLVDMD